MVNFPWTRPRTLQAGATVLLSLAPSSALNWLRSITLIASLTATALQAYYYYYYRRMCSHLATAVVLLKEGGAHTEIDQRDSRNLWQINPVYRGNASQSPPLSLSLSLSLDGDGDGWGNVVKGILKPNNQMQKNCPYLRRDLGLTIK